MVRTGWKITGDTNENGQWYHGVDLLYNSAGLVWISRSSKWQLNSSNAVINEVGLAAMEYRYDSARGRYRTQRRDPRTKLANGSSNTAHFLFPYDPSLADGPCWNVPAEGTWSDYSGDGIHGDYTLAISGTPPNQTVTKNDTAGHEPGLGQFGWTTGSTPAPSDPNYAYGNLIGTTEAMTDDTSSVSRRAVFTAFGEPVYENGATDTRYGYAGAWGYQEAGTGDPLVELGWQHVGYRYYDPSSGRFVQRDPIGIRGGLNTYVYVFNIPTFVKDPEGLRPDFLARWVLCVTGKISSWSGIDLDDPAAVEAAAAGFRQTGFAALGAATGIAAPVQVGLGLAIGTEAVAHTGASTGNPDLDQCITVFSRGAGLGSLITPQPPSAVGGTLRGLPGSPNGPYRTIP